MREAIIPSRDECGHGIDLLKCAIKGPELLALYMEEWFTTGSGVSWQWKSQQALSLITKIRQMNTSEMARLIC